MSKISIKIKNNNFKSVHIVLIKDNKVLILKRSSTDQWMPGHFGLPGGKIEDGEDILDAACRECQEETNINISPKDLIFLQTISNNKEHAFYYTTKFTGTPKLDFEHEEFNWVNPENLTKYKVVADLPEIISEAFKHLKDKES